MSVHDSAAHDPAAPRAAREQLVSFAAAMAADGLAIGSAGNLSVRVGDRVLITPSGVSYAELTADLICEIAGVGGAAAQVPAAASSETPLHLAIYAAADAAADLAAATGADAVTNAAAVVHTHSPEVIALSVTAPELPAVHYAIADLGGPVRVAPYHRFGSPGLAAAVASALSGRHAVILQNHGAVTTGPTLAVAYDRARLLEWLAHVYRLARSLGSPRILSAGELAEVAEHMRAIGYGSTRRP